MNEFEQSGRSARSCEKRGLVGALVDRMFRLLEGDFTAPQFNRWQKSADEIGRGDKRDIAKGKADLTADLNLLKRATIGTTLDPKPGQTPSPNPNNPIVVRESY